MTSSSGATYPFGPSERAQSQDLRPADWSLVESQSRFGERFRFVGRGRGKMGPQ